MQTGIKVQLPKAETGESESAKNVIITLTDAGNVYLNGDQLPLTALGPKLAALIGQEKEQVVILKADRMVSLQRTVEVIDIAKAVGAAKFMIATAPK